MAVPSEMTMSSPLPITLVGGAFLGTLQASWPFARLAIGQDKLVLAAMMQEHVVTPSDQVELVWDLHPLLGFRQGVRILHAQPDLPERIVFLYLRSQKLKRLLDATDFTLNME